jgi:hypothetical protein
MAGLKKSSGKFFKLSNDLVVFFSPVEGLFEALLSVVGIIFGVYAITDYKNLNVLKQPTGSPE